MRPGPIGILVLAAGGSTRMGTPKQLLRYGGKTLVRAAAEAAVECGAGPVVVVTGCAGSAVEKELAGLPVRVARSESWALGMGASLRAGVGVILSDAPDAAALLITLCDQPRVSAASLRRVIEAHVESGRGLCAAGFDDAVGPPVLFSRGYFEELLTIPDGAGAKQVLNAHPQDVCRVDCPEAALDLDTPADYQRLGEGPGPFT